MRIYPPKKVYVDKSPIHGLGVFASELIYRDEIIEVCPLYDLGVNMQEQNDIMINYRFNWPQGINPISLVLPWGYGCIYNHSENSNASWRSNIRNYTFEFFAIRDIEIGEEICTYYGGENYWSDKRASINLK